MIHYIGAELYRIFRKKSIYILAITATVLLFAVIFIMDNPQRTTADYMLVGKFIINFATVLLGTLIFSLIYLDDFKAKSSSAIISCGESRNLFVFSKQVISVIVTILAYAVMMGVFFIGAAVLGYVFTGEQMTELVFSAFGSILTVLGYLAIGGLIAYGSQNGVLSLICFLLLSVGFVDMVVGTALKLPIFSELFGGIQSYLLSAATSTWVGELSQHVFAWKWFLVCMGYIIIPTVISVFLFRKKDLDIA